VQVHLGDPFIADRSRIAECWLGISKEMEKKRRQHVSNKFFRPDHWPKHQTKWFQQQFYRR
jgi:hypothetical protein